jgi:PAS domain S-box-containing protein
MTGNPIAGIDDSPAPAAVDAARDTLRPQVQRLVALRAELDDDAYRAHAETVPAIVWVADPDGRARFLNGRWYAFTGLDPQRSVGYGWNDAIHRDDLDPAFKRWTHAINTGEPLDVTYRFRGRDGGYRWHLGYAILRRDEGGRALEWIGACADLQAPSGSPAVVAEEAGAGHP